MLLYSRKAILLSDCRRSLFLSIWLKNVKVENFQIFYQTHRLTPSEKCKFWKSLTSKRSLKKLFFIRISTIIFVINLTRKSLDKEISNFWPKSWTIPFLKKCKLCSFYQWFCSREKLVLNQGCRQTAFFYQFSGTTSKKFQIFDQNHRLTPLEKCTFCTFLTSIILQSKKVIFLLRMSTITFYQFYPRKSRWRNFKFLTKTMDYPLWENANFLNFPNFYHRWFCSVNILFFFQNVDHYFFDQFDPKKSRWRNFKFLTKTMD